MSNNDMEWNPDWTHLLKVKAIVDEIYQFRDHFFEENDLSEAKNKNKRVEEKLEQMKIELKNNEGKCLGEDRAVYWYLKGRALNVLTSYDAECEELLSRAIKQNPKLSAAWNELGECFWKKGNIASAVDCFDGAMKFYRDKVSLRNLSMGLRQLPTTSDSDKEANFEKSLRIAKEAVSLDPTDGVSLTILGNAYLQAFFHLSQDPKTLKLSMNAYNQAENDAVAKSNPDLYYNKAVLWIYTQEYEKALDALEKAKSLDPLWVGLAEKQTELQNYLEKIQDLVQHRGRLKPKRLQQILKRLSVKDLGYHNPTATNLTDTKPKLKQVKLSGLSDGMNEVIVLGKVVCTVYIDHPVPFVFCIMDEEMTCVCVSVYNLAEGKGMIIGDSIAIPRPLFSNVKVKYKDKEIAFPLIRVETPLNLIINGKVPSKAIVAAATSATLTKTE